MRKQTKLVAVLSAAALLAMGASMTSFAAGWQKDDAGVWHYYGTVNEYYADDNKGTTATALPGTIVREGGFNGEDGFVWEP